MSRDEPFGIQTWMLFLKAHSTVIEELKRHMLEQHQLKLTWFDVLAQLNRHGGRLRMADLAESVLLSNSGLTRLLDRMEVQGFIAREPCHDDRRGYWAVLTPEGRRKVREVWPSHEREIYDSFLNLVGENDQAAFHRALNQIAHGHAPE